MLKAIADNLKGLWSLVVGLAITGRFAASPQLTVHYPRRAIADEDLVTFRGPVELVPAEGDPTQSKCVACGMCAKACPSGCLTVVKGEGKSPKTWLCDFTMCSLCGTCAEVCPAHALRFSHDIYWVAERRQDMVRDLLAILAKNGRRD